MWETDVDGQPLKFHLAGINNQNFIMRDETTNSWWQQVSGAAIHGPLKGKQLKQVFVDEISFAVWKREHSNGRVLRPDEKFKAKYEKADWEASIQRMPVVTQADPQDRLKPRALIVGLELNGKSKAYAQDDLVKQCLTLDELGGVPIFLVVGEDGQSVRAFERSVNGRTLEFFVKQESSGYKVLTQSIEVGGSTDQAQLEQLKALTAKPVAPLELVDAETGSTWDFSGVAVSGQLAGQKLKPVALLKDFWFDWKLYHPSTTIYSLGERLGNWEGTLRDFSAWPARMLALPGTPPNFLTKEKVLPLNHSNLKRSQYSLTI